MVGASKLAGTADMVQLFEAVGIGQWFRYVTGSIEVASAVSLLIPSFAFFGAVALAIIGWRDRHGSVHRRAQ